MNDAFFFTCVKYTLSSIKTICDDYLLGIFYRYNQTPLIRTLQEGGGGIESVHINEVSYIKKDVKF